VGLSEGGVQGQGIEARVAKLPTSAVLRTHTIDERQGFMKALVAAGDDHILGRVSFLEYAAAGRVTFDVGRLTLATAGATFFTDPQCAGLTPLRAT
jgi:hypothetical protein